MPIKTIRRNGRISGYRWGSRGKLYKRRSDAVKQGRPCQHYRRIKTKRGYSRKLINKGVKKRRNYGSLFGKKKQIYYVSDQEFGEKLANLDYETDKGYGKVHKISGKKAGGIIAASGVVVPVVLPVPITTLVGAIVANTVDNVSIQKPSEGDPKHRLIIERKK